EPVGYQRESASAVRRHRCWDSKTGPADRIQPLARCDHPCGRQARRARTARFAEGARDRGGAIMPARLLDGVATADRIRSEIVPRVAAFAARAHRPPGLGIVLVGENPASEIYVRGKVKSAGDLGIRVDLERLSAT